MRGPQAASAFTSRNDARPVVRLARPVLRPVWPAVRRVNTPESLSMMPRMHITVATALLMPHRRLHPIVQEARLAAQWKERVMTGISLTAHVEHHAWLDKFRTLMAASPWLGVSNDPDQPTGPRPGDAQYRGNDRRHLKQQLTKHQRRLEVLGSMWLSAQPKQRKRIK